VGLLKRAPQSRVVLETSAEAFAVADIAREAGHEVRVVPATIVKGLGVGARGIKTDARDSSVMSEVSCRIDLPSVHIPSDRSRDRKSLSACRENLVEARTCLINGVRGWTRTQLLRIRSGAVETFAKRVRERLLSDSNGMPSFIERQLIAIEALNEQIAVADKEMVQLAKEDEVCARLMTVPGVGPVVSIHFAATLDVIERFDGAHSVESYLGLTPGENSSGMRQRRGGITKAGSKRTRALLVQAAWTLWRTQPGDPIASWVGKVAERRGKKVAVVALARKLAGILYAMWRDKKNYNPCRGASPQPQQA
jgi:transposase